MSSSFLRKTIKDDERPFLIDGRETLGRSFQILFGPFWVEVRKSFCCATKANSKVILGVTELCFVLGVVKHNSAFSWSLNPHVKKILHFFYQIILPLRILQVSMQTDFKSNDDLKKIVFKKLFHMFSS